MPSDEHPASKYYPELRHFDSRKDAQAALKAWQKELIKKPRFWIALLAYTVVVGLFVTLIFVSLRHWFRIPPRLSGPIVGGITGGSCVAWIAWFWQNRCRRYLREQLVARGIPICIKCGYDLRGQIEPRCSECGMACDTKLIDKGDQDSAI